MFDTADERLRLPRVLEPRNAAVAKALLAHYLTDFTGRGFETVGHRWDDPAHANVVTPSDLVALACLSVPVAGDTALHLLVDEAAVISELLRQLPEPHVTLWKAEADKITAPDAPLQTLWRTLRAVPGMGPTSTSKLLARKRANLVPIYDSVVAEAFGMRSSAGQWGAMRELLLSDTGSGALHEHLAELTRDVPGAEVVTPLRVLDIIVWYAHHPSPNQAVRRRHAFEQAGLDAEDAESAITRA